MCCSSIGHVLSARRNVSDLPWRQDQKPTTNRVSDPFPLSERERNLFRETGSDGVCDKFARVSRRLHFITDEPDRGDPSARRLVGKALSAKKSAQSQDLLKTDRRRKARDEQRKPRGQFEKRLRIWSAAIHRAVVCDGFGRCRSGQFSSRDACSQIETPLTGAGRDGNSRVGAIHELPLPIIAQWSIRSCCRSIKRLCEG